MQTTVDLSTLESLHAAFELTDRSTIARVLALFLEDAPPRARALRDLHEAGDLSSLRRSAHRLCGTSAIIGAAPLAAFCRAIEEASDEHERGIAIELVEREMDRVIFAVRRQIGQF